MYIKEYSIYNVKYNDYIQEYYSEIRKKRG